MNISQKQSILNSIESILAFDFDNFIIENNATGNLDEIKFGEYTVEEFKTTYLKVFKQLKNELEKGIGLLLPNQETFNNEFSQVTLDSETSHFYTYLQNFPNRHSAAEVLKRFAYFQIRYGFWNKSTVKQHPIDVEKLHEAQEKLLLAQKNLTENLNIFEKLKAELKSQIEDFSNILVDKKKESIDITNLLDKAKTESNSINNLLSSSSSKDTDISNLVTSITAKLATISENINEYQLSFTEIKNANKKISGELTQELEDAKLNLNDSKEGNEFINSQRDEIKRLIGMAADGSLGYKFNSRKEELENGIKYFWRLAVPGSIVIALGWVYVVFTYLNANFSNEWINLLVNLIKTTPVWILVGFIFSHYSKERDLQEEYAFKSAVAMTLTAYSEMLCETDGEKDKTKSSKQEMLLKSIENIYKQPVLKVEKTEKYDFTNSKQFMDSLKSLSESIKNVKP